LYLPRIAPDSLSHGAIKAHADDIWREYLSVDRDFNPRRLLDRLALIASETRFDPADACAFAQGVAEAFSARAAGSSDIFRQSEVVAACAVSLLSRADDRSVGATLIDIASNVVELTSCALARTVALLVEDKYALLSGRGSFGDLFYLPLRLSRLLGWIGAQHFVCKWMGRVDALDGKMTESLVSRLLDTYTGSFVAVSDSQAPFLLTFLRCCHERGWDEAAELVIGSMFNNFIGSGGHVASPGIDADRVCEFLIRRSDGNFGDAFDLLARPCESLSVLLLGSHWFSLSDVLNSDLHLLDHVSFNLFIPSDHRELGKAIIRNGINNTYEIGRGIWRAEEFASAWNKDCVPQIGADPQGKAPSVKVGALYAALLFPDRCPWFIAADNSHS
jgi:hypothetical protein